MQYFFNEIISPLVIKNKYKDICEIGAEFGGNTDNLLGIDFVRVSTIDPCVDADLQNKYRSNDRIKIYNGFSLQVLPELSGQFDCFLIDGDHNWYSVFNELKTIHEKDLLRKGGVIFLHDVLWPYGRRDMYYFPESIQEKFRHSYSQEGIERGRSELSGKSSNYKGMNNRSYYSYWRN